ncbi:M15 family metallopeptidase [Ornithinibacillus xuwenensis]|uniref:M15 family metallopeptidase n=1 Tax=Ornithinibacillus xuwenensis TaxID=3144668 RepID=A0ABU9XM18_9BACI
MKRYRGTIITIILFGLVLLFIFLFIYQYFGYNKYIYYGKDAPIITELHPIVSAKSKELVEKANQKNISMVITESFRSTERQDKLYAQGRKTEGNIVTHAQGGESYHNYGLAIDFALEDEEGNYIWDTAYDGNGNHIADWDEIVIIAKELGFEWGGDWRSFKDYPHLQMTFGLSIKQLQRGLRPKTEIAE